MNRPKGRGDVILY